MRRARSRSGLCSSASTAAMRRSRVGCATTCAAPAAHRACLQGERGPLPPDHWLNDPDEGGGTAVGEGCHFVDFACWLAGALPRRVVCRAAGPRQADRGRSGFTVALEFPTAPLRRSSTSQRGRRLWQGARRSAFRRTVGGPGGLPLAYALTAPASVASSAVAAATRANADQIRAVRDVLAGALAVSDPDPLDTMATMFTALRAASGVAGEAVTERSSQQLHGFVAGGKSVTGEATTRTTA